MLTRKETKEAFINRGFSEAAAEILCRETASSRHAARCAFVKKHFGTPKGKFMCLLDTLGVGGKDSMEGTGTSRVPDLAAVCGKGRKKATDGPAWTAAISTNLPKTCIVKSTGFWVDGEEVVLTEEDEDALGLWLRTWALEALRRAAGKDVQWLFPEVGNDLFLAEDMETLCDLVESLESAFWFNKIEGKIDFVVGDKSFLLEECKKIPDPDFRKEAEAAVRKSLENTL